MLFSIVKLSLKCHNLKCDTFDTRYPQKQETSPNNVKQIERKLQEVWRNNRIGYMYQNLYREGI